MLAPPMPRETSVSDIGPDPALVGTEILLRLRFAVDLLNLCRSRQKEWSGSAESLRVFATYGSHDHMSSLVWQNRKVDITKIRTMRT
jgi:hypothetical protein